MAEKTATHRAVYGLVGLGVALQLMAAAGDARADDKKRCANAYEAAQEQRQASKLRQARAQLLVCAQPSCPDFVRGDCVKWLDEVEESMPSVVFVARDGDGNDLTDVKVSVGEDILVEALDGKATPVDPGAQVFRFEAAGFDPVDKKVIVAQGQKNRAITVQLGSSAPAGEEPGQAARTEAQGPDFVEKTPSRTLAFVLGGVGVVGLAGFTLMGLSGKSQENDLRDSCSPNCDESDVDEVRSKYLLADISLTVGVVSLGLATYFFLKPPGGGDATTEKAQVRLDVGALRSGGLATVSGRF